MVEFKRKILTNKSIVVHCKTHEQAKQLLKWGHKNGKEWGAGNSYIDEDYYRMHRPGTACYCIAGGHHSSLQTFIDCETEYEIIPFENALQINKFKNKFKKFKEKKGEK